MHLTISHDFSRFLTISPSLFPFSFFLFSFLVFWFFGFLFFCFFAFFFQNFKCQLLKLKVSKFQSGLKGHSFVVSSEQTRKKNRTAFLE